MFRYIFSFCCFLSLVTGLEKSQIEESPFTHNGGRIAGGEDAAPGQFPWQVKIVTSSPFGFWSCGGSIINQSWILTSGQCIHEGDLALISAGYIEFNFDGVISINLYTHEEFNSSTFENDVGLIKLIDPLVFHENISAVGLSSEPVGAGVNLTVTGWGAAEDGGMYPYLKYATVTTIENSECASVYGEDIIHDNIFCTAAGDPPKGACLGDTGSAAVVSGENGPAQVGIASFISARGCENGDPSAHTRVAEYKHWIKEKTGIDF